MNIRFDFAIHWLFAVVFAILTISGVAMIGAGFGWLLQYDIALADYVHRIAAVFFVVLTLIYIGSEVMNDLRGNISRHRWGIFKPKKYGLFTLTTSVMLILSGAIIWGSDDTNSAAVAFAMFVHEKLTYVALAGVIWHIYQKAHALIWPRFPKEEGGATNLMLEPGFKLFIWVLVTAYFFSAAAIIISAAGPPPGNIQVRKFMAGMDQAMDSSLMGLAGKDMGVNPVIKLTPLVLVETLLAAMATSILVMWRRGNK
ncbi:MAG TPA: cytochrome b/b6 domain-containing protein [Selenomonadales bacterium]|nr:cytochrome b/b6 domain-containing protein [Selenomonadales bacterium]